MSIKISNLCFSYAKQPVLKDVSIDVKYGELMSILGPNGVGKSTLFKCILGLLKNYTGLIKVDGTDIRNLSAGKMAKLISYIPQSNYPSFNYSVFDMVLMGTTSQVSAIFSPGKKQRDQVLCSLHRLGITHLASKSYAQISGGERQLTLIARALVQDARVLILDEPTSSLDYGNQLLVMAQIKSLAADGYTVVQSTHNPEQAFLFSDHILALKDGSVLADGPPAKIVTPELMRSLYGTEIEVHSIHNDRIRVCVPKINLS